MRCSTLRSTDMAGTCLGSATHMLLYTTPDVNGQPDDRTSYTDPVCEPCGRAYECRPHYKARIVPLHIYTPAPNFKGNIEGHRLVDHPEHEAQCHDCLRTGSIPQFQFSMLHGCPARPESVDHLALTGDAIWRERNGRAEESARLWFHEAAYVLGMSIGDWRPVFNHPVTCAHFTFRDREYRVKYDLAGHRIVAEKLENRGRPAPELINPEYENTYKQVVFHFYDLVNKYESTYFATWTPGRKDVILYAPEGQIASVLRITGFNEPESTRLAQVTDWACDAFGPVADITFRESIYE